MSHEVCASGGTIDADRGVIESCVRSVIADGRLGHTKAPAVEAQSWILEWLTDMKMDIAADELLKLPIAGEAWTHSMRYWAMQRAYGSKPFSTAWWQCVYLLAHYPGKESIRR